MTRLVYYLLGAITGGILALLGSAVVEPDCPTEDSCELDYRDGAWHITEVTP
jgi:hypothetical protein